MSGLITTIQTDWPTTNFPRVEALGPAIGGFKRFQCSRDVHRVNLKDGPLFRFPL